MFLWNTFNAYDPINDLLKKDDLKLEELLDQSTLSNAMKNSHQDLLSFIEGAEVMTDLLDWTLTQKYKDEQKYVKYSRNSVTILSSNNANFQRRLQANVLFVKRLREYTASKPLEPRISGHFERIFENLVRASKGAALKDFPNIANYLMDNMTDIGLRDLFVTLATEFNDSFNATPDMICKLVSTINNENGYYVVSALKQILLYKDDKVNLFDSEKLIDSLFQLLIAQKVSKPENSQVEQNQQQQQETQNDLQQQQTTENCEQEHKSEEQQKQDEEPVPPKPEEETAPQTPKPEEETAPQTPKPEEEAAQQTPKPEEETAQPQPQQQQHIPEDEKVQQQKPEDEAKIEIEAKENVANDARLIDPLLETDILRLILMIRETENYPKVLAKYAPSFEYREGACSLPFEVRVFQNLSPSFLLRLLDHCSGTLLVDAIFEVFKLKSQQEQLHLIKEANLLSQIMNHFDARLKSDGFISDLSFHIVSKIKLLSSNDEAATSTNSELTPDFNSEFTKFGEFVAENVSPLISKRTEPFGGDVIKSDEEEDNKIDMSKFANDDLIIDDGYDSYEEDEEEDAEESEAESDDARDSPTGGTTPTIGGGFGLGGVGLGALDLGGVGFGGAGGFSMPNSNSDPAMRKEKKPAQPQFGLSFGSVTGMVERRNTKPE